MRAILRGRLVVDSLRGINSDIGVVVDNGIIIDVGRFSDVVKNAGNRDVREFDGIICPALINAHTHLELSSFRKNQFHHSDFVDWVIKLVNARLSMMSADVGPDCRRAKREAEEGGTGFFVNVGNDFDLNRSLGDNQLFAFEQIGINESSSEKIFARSREIVFAESRVRTALAVHAPYSVSPSLMKSIKSYNNLRGCVTSIHLSETVDEVEFVMSGTGRMTDLLNQRVGKWQFNPSGMSPVEYVDSLGLLDNRTLCVHCVFTDEKDLDIMSKRGSAVSVCVRSNRELSGHVPALEKFLQKGVRVLIGTDSLASSPDLDMFSEIAAFYSEFHGVVTPEQVFRSATYDAAEFLGIANSFGSISAGTIAALVYAPFDGKGEEVLEYLATGAQGKIMKVHL